MATTGKRTWRHTLLRRGMGVPQYERKAAEAAFAILTSAVGKTDSCRVRALPDLPRRYFSFCHAVSYGATGGLAWVAPVFEGMPTLPASSMSSVHDVEAGPRISVLMQYLKKAVPSELLFQHLEATRLGDTGYTGLPATVGGRSDG